MEPMMQKVFLNLPSSGYFLIGSLESVEKQAQGHYALALSRKNRGKFPTAEIILGYPTTPDGQRSEFADAIEWLGAAIGSGVVVQVDRDPKIKGSRLIHRALRVWRLADLLAS